MNSALRPQDYAVDLVKCSLEFTQEVVSGDLILWLGNSGSTELAVRRQKSLRSALTQGQKYKY